MTDIRPPKDDLVRAIFPGVELRAAAKPGVMPTMHGHFAVFDSWARIDSSFEGLFMERIAPGAFKKTFAENRGAMKVTLNHGSDPQAGDKPLGPITVLEEDATGAHYEVPLLDTSYNRDIAPGLEAGLYGASFRFQVVKDELEPKPKPSAYNPDGIPERSIREARVMEFGPVTYPAYAGATAGVRSLTDAYVLERFARDPARLNTLLESVLPERSLDDLAAFLLADKAALQAAIDKLSGGEPLLAQEADLLEAAIEHLEPPDADEDDMQMASASVSDDTHSRTEPVTATPTAASRTSPFRSIQEFDQWLHSQTSATSTD
jgi:HK97 family phage prohead protease